MPGLADLYRRLTFTYPPEYRESHQREIVSTLLEAASDGQRVPRLRQAWALVIGGLRLRALQADRRGPRGLWADALRLGAALSLVSLLPTSLIEAVFSPYLRPHLDLIALAFPVMLALTVIALFRQPRRWGLILVGAVLVTGARDNVSIPALQSSIGAWALVGYLSVAVPCAVSAAAFWVADSGRRSGSWSWWWVAALLVIPVVMPRLGSPLLDVVVLTAASVLIRDTRWGVAGLVVSVVFGLGSGAWLVGGGQGLLVAAGGMAVVSVIATLIAEIRLARAS